jgi:LysM repeat protein
MKEKLLITGIILGLCTFLSPAARSAESLEVLEEKINHLTSIVEDLEFRQKKLEEQLDKVKEDLRNIGSSETSADLKALQDRIAAIDAAREKDKRVIIDELSRQLAAISSGKTIASGKPASGHEHTVAKGETLSSIAKAQGCSVADLKKLNNLTSDNISVGQKLVIPQK